MLYKATDFYAPSHEGGIPWNDPLLQIDWPVAKSFIAPRDAAWPALQSG
jgi:dTDP-4-dehydrorhamnose 3,5-epimerase